MPEPDDRPWRRAGDTLELRVRLTPKGGRDAIDGVTASPDGSAIKARVRAAPEDGEANAALIELIADWLDVPKREVTLAGGHKSRTKIIAITADVVTTQQRLQSKLTALSDQPAQRTEKRR